MYNVVMVILIVVGVVMIAYASAKMRNARPVKKGPVMFIEKEKK